MIKEIKEIRERLEKATPGPWSIGYWWGQCKKLHAHHGNNCTYEYELRTDTEISHHSIVLKNDPVTLVETTTEYGAMSRENAELIANAPTDIEYLLKLTEKLTTQRNRWIEQANTNQSPLDVEAYIESENEELSCMLKDGK